MIPKMPALIPTKNIHKLSPQFHPPHSPQFPLKYLHQTISPSDDKLNKDLDDQVQLVKTLQEMLLTEEKRLEMMLKQFHTRNGRRMSQEPTKKKTWKTSRF